MTYGRRSRQRFRDITGIGIEGNTAISTVGVIHEVIGLPHACLAAYRDISSSKDRTMFRKALSGTDW